MNDIDKEKVLLLLAVRQRLMEAINVTANGYETLTVSVLEGIVHSVLLKLMEETLAEA